MYIRETIDVIIDELNMETFAFTLLDNYNIVLCDYYLKQRETKRHKFKTIKQYDRHRTRDCMNVKEVPLTKEIEKLVLELFVSKLKVVKE